MKKKITVLGAGNGGLTAAYHLAKMGYSICLYDLEAFPEQINKINETGTIIAKESEGEDVFIFPGTENIDVATVNPEIAGSYSDIFVMVCPSFAQEILFSKVIPFLKKDDTVILMPGNYGGLALDKMLKDAGLEGLNITFVDAISIPWATRIVEPGVISIMGIKEYLPVSIYPAKNVTSEMIDKISGCIPIPIKVLDNPIVSGLENINFGGHPLMTTLNIGLLENFNGEFNYYADCCSKATANAADKMDKERIEVANALGFEVLDELTAMNTLYNSNYKTVYEFNRSSATHGKIHNAPNSSKNRYITEDVPYLLVPCYELAQLAGVKANIVASIIHIASAYNDENYFETGRTLHKMGLSDLTLEEVKQKFKG